MFSSLRNTIILAAVMFAVGLSVGGVGIHKWDTNSFEAKLAKQEREAGVALAKATQDSTDKANTLLFVKEQADLQHEKDSKLVERTLADNRAIVQRVGLHDPGRGQSCTGAISTVSPASGVVTVTADAGRLSDQASEFLLNFAADADRAAEYANTCHTYVAGLSSVLAQRL